MSEQNNTSYLGNQNIKGSNVKVSFTPEQVEEYIKCSEDPIYFIENYVKIVNLDEGLVNFKMYDFQKDMIRSVHDNRFVIAKLPRQSGKSTSVVSYILHFVLFKDNMNVAILANKQDIARDLLAKVKTAYEYLPKWLQQGVVEWNKGSILLENGSRIKAAATSSSAIRGGSYNCISGESIVTVRNPKTNEIFDISVNELYSNSSRNINNYIYSYGNNKQQIQEVVLFPYDKGAKSCYGRINDNRKSSHNSKISWRNKRKIEHSKINNKRTFIGSSTSSEIFEWDRQIKDVSCILSYGKGKTRNLCQTFQCCDNRSEEKLFRSEKSNENWHKTFRRNKEKNINIKYGKNYFEFNPTKNIQSKYGKIVREKETNWIWAENFNSINWEKENDRSHKQNKQESKQNKKNGRKASRNETIRRSKSPYECSGERKNYSSRWTLEQGDKDGRWEVYTPTGFKKFHGISKTANKKTIKITLENNKTIICTPDHEIKIHNIGFVAASSLSVGDIVCCDLKNSSIVFIEQHNIIDVYDLLEVEEHNSFYANGILVKNCIFLDEFAYVPPHIADEFYSSVYPTISSGQDTKILIVSTPNGLNMFYKIWTDAENERNSFIPVEVHWNQVPGRDNEWKKKQIANTSEQQFRVEFECSFIGSTNTLIDPTKLKVMAYQDPIYKNEQGVWIYEYPEKDHLYTMVIDTSRGQSIDYHAFAMIDITSIPYKVVATFKNNEISPIIYPNLIYPIARKYNDAYILVEINDIGSQIADILHSDFEYDNILSSVFKGRKGQMLSSGFGGGSSMFGIRTTKAVKRLGCSILKSMVEDDKLLITDYRIIQELVTFITKKTSYEAEVGHNDDLVMCLVLFSWLTSQEYFKELTNLDMKKNIFQDKIKQLEEEIVPFGFIEDGQSPEYEKDDKGNVWYTVF